MLRRHVAKKNPLKIKVKKNYVKFIHVQFVHENENSDVTY